MSSSFKPLNTLMLLGLVIGNVIGSGIYVLPTTLAAYGSISLLAWVLTGAGAMLLAWVFSDLNRRLPWTGGPYVYAREVFGPFVGFFIAYSYWVGLWIANAAIVVSSVNYLGVLWPVLNDQSPAYQPWCSFGIKAGWVWVFTWLNLKGVRAASVFEIGMTVIKLAPLFVIISLGLFHMHWEHLTAFNTTEHSHGSALIQAAALTVWAFMGIETATIPAEATTGWRAVRRATLWGTGVATVTYITITLVLMGLIPLDQLAQAPFPVAEAARMLMGHTAAQWVGLFACIAGLGALNVSILLQGQIPFAASRDGLFPPCFQVRNRHDAPIWGLVGGSVGITALLLLTTHQSLVDQFLWISLLAILASLLTYWIAAMAALWFAIQHIRREGWRGHWHGVLLSSLAGLYTLWMIVGTGADIVFEGVLLLLSAFTAFVWVKR